MYSGGFSVVRRRWHTRYGLTTSGAAEFAVLQDERLRQHLGA
jgi:hypothetical protein